MAVCNSGWLAIYMNYRHEQTEAIAYRPLRLIRQEGKFSYESENRL